MKTIIVPVDFLDTSKNAAMFAAHAATEIKDARILLYYQFDDFVAGSDSSPLEDEPEARKKIGEMALQNVRASMLEVSASLDISYTASEESSFLDGLEKFVRTQNADLVIMGISDTNAIEQALVGNNSLKLADRNVCPVMIIPPLASYKSLKTALFQTDFEDLDTPTAGLHVRAVLDIFRPLVFVADLATQDAQAPERLKTQKQHLETIMQGYHYSFHLLDSDDFSSAISSFVAEKEVDFIISISRQQSFFSSLFETSHTKQLVYHSQLPVVVING